MSSPCRRSGSARRRCIDHLPADACDPGDRGGHASDIRATAALGPDLIGAFLGAGLYAFDRNDIRVVRMDLVVNGDGCDIAADDARGLATALRKAADELRRSIPTG
ncbi:hypothetical protein ACIRRA_45635 [Nocardia sp. NPDC101769]|uniref:hypothetical protein n=1 Tax=Nocardia sp. NPDC101769 TaxID=3364333 RepID=UPI0037F74117